MVEFRFSKAIDNNRSTQTEVCPKSRLSDWENMLILFIAAWVIAEIQAYELQKRLQASSDYLLPGDDPTPRNFCYGGTPKGALTILLGERAAFATNFPTKVIAINDDMILEMNKDEHGDIAVTTDIFDQNNDLVASIENNRFRVVQDAIVERKDLHSLKVTIKHRKEQVYMCGTSIRQPSALLVYSGTQVTQS